jgi:hypothetical protein
MLLPFPIPLLSKTKHQSTILQSCLAAYIRRNRKAVMTEQVQYKGSCLCGAITISITGKPFETHLCHCRSCKKLTGCEFGSFVMWPKEVRRALVSHADGKPR